MSGSLVEREASPGASGLDSDRGACGVNEPCASRLTGVRTESPNATFGVGRASAPYVPASDVPLASSVARESHGWY